MTIKTILSAGALQIHPTQLGDSFQAITGNRRFIGAVHLRVGDFDRPLADVHQFFALCLRKFPLQSFRQETAIQDLHDLQLRQPVVPVDDAARAAGGAQAPEMLDQGEDRRVLQPHLPAVALDADAAQRLHGAQRQFAHGFLLSPLVGGWTRGKEDGLAAGRRPPTPALFPPS